MITEFQNRSNEEFSNLICKSLLATEKTAVIFWRGESVALALKGCGSTQGESEGLTTEMYASYLFHSRP